MKQTLNSWLRLLNDLLVGLTEIVSTDTILSWIETSVQDLVGSSSMRNNRMRDLFAAAATFPAPRYANGLLAIRFMGLKA